MKKLLFLGLLIALVLVAANVSAATTADTARAASTAGQAENIVAVTDGQSGALLNIDPQGSAQVSEFTEECSDIKHISSQILAGSGRIGTITCNSATAESYLLIYDALTATGTPKIDVQMDVANEQYTVPLNFDIATGIYVDYSGSGTEGDVTYSVTYDVD